MRAHLSLGLLAMSLLGCLFGRSPSLKSTDTLPSGASFVVFDDGKGLVAVDPSASTVFRWSPREASAADLRGQKTALLGYRLLTRSGLSLTLHVRGGGELSVSPDLSRYAYAAAGESGASSVRIANLDGSGETTLEATGASPTWLPDGTIGSRGGDQLSGTTIVRQRPDGADRQVVVDAGGAGISYLEWSPDGARVAFSISASSGETRIDVVHADGTEGRPLIDVPGGSAIRPRWSPDGARIAALVRPPADSKLHAPTNLWVAEVATSRGGPILTLESKEPSVLPGGAYRGVRELAWSPDGRSIAFFAALAGDCLKNTAGELICQHDLYVVGADGSNLRRVYKAQMRDPRRLVWLP